MGLVKNKLEQHGVLDEAELHVVAAEATDRDRLLQRRVFSCNAFDRRCFRIRIKTPVGTIIHTGDFKIDPTPIDGKLFDLHTLSPPMAIRASWLSFPTARMRSIRDTRHLNVP